MARGYCYEICSDKEDIWSLSETDLYKYAGHEFDYVSNLASEDSIEETTGFAEMLKNCGAEVIDVTNDNRDNAYRVVFAKDTKLRYFSQRFTSLKKLAAEITAEQFFEDSMELYNLRKAITEPYGDMVYLDSSLYDLDWFIRNAEVGKEYYIGNAVLIH